MVVNLPYMSSLLEESYSAPETPKASSGPPFASYQYAKVLNGIPTELLVQIFDDRVLVILTQLGKIGSLVSRHEQADDQAE